jgi:ribosomal protein L11 methyltransferase
LRRVSVRVPAAEAEIARARMLPLAPTGFEEVELGGTLELAAYTDAEGAERIATAFGSVSSTAVEPGWEERWREFHRPVRAAGLWIGPPWEEPPAGWPAVVVEPGRAFGTGAHPTTRACIELLAGRARGSVLDAGCGSGVIAVAAARLGFAPVLAVDADPVAVEVAVDTARRNGVEIEAWAADVLTDELPGVDLVVANIELHAVERLLIRRPASCVIASGYLAHETAAAPGWERVARYELEGWAADVVHAMT